MIKKLILVLIAFSLISVPVFMAGVIADDTVGLPEKITSDSACPATGCASGVCHGFDNVPSPDGVHEMVCPEASCSSVECHAWDTMMGRYHQASNASLNLWIVMPVVLVLTLVLIVKKVR